MRTDKERDKMLNSFADPEGSDSMEFKISRNQGDNLTFSPDVLQQFKEDVFLFIGGRICAFQDRTNKPAQKIRVNISVEVDSFSG